MDRDEATYAYDIDRSDLQESENEAALQGHQRSSSERVGHKYRLALGCGGVLAIAATFAARSGAGPAQSSGVAQPVSDESIHFSKPGSVCSAFDEDCRSAGCCKTTGFTCFEKDDTTAFCKQECPADKGWTCRNLNQSRELEVRSPGTSLYCYAVIFEKKGGNLPVPEAEILKSSFGKGLSIFACEAFDVFSDVAVSFGSKYDAVKLEDVDQDFCKFKRPDTEACANAAIHYQAWLAIRGTQKWKDQEWVVKADADAVFIPSRLRNLLVMQKQPDTGVYYENCKGVESGFFGNLEVISAKGFDIFTRKLENCKATLAWDGNPASGWKYGPWGEDKFAQECMDKHGVGKLPLYELTYDGACPADRPDDQKKNQRFVPPCWNSSAPSTHPFMSVESWMDCYDTTIKVTV